MLNPIENRLMKDFMPHVEVVYGTPELARSGALQDYTSKEGGGEASYSRQEKGYNADPEKEYYEKLKKKYGLVTELQLKLSEKIRLQLNEYGEDLLLIMIDYWKKAW